MSTITMNERMALERVFGMETGYVLDFSNTTFRTFVWESVQKDIQSSAYEKSSSSKANRLRRFWEVEPGEVVGKLLKDLLIYYEREAVILGRENDPKVIRTCGLAAERLLPGGEVIGKDSFVVASGDPSYLAVAQAVVDAIDRKEFQESIDRLHTFMTLHMRTLCAAQGITVEPSKPLHSLFGEFVKLLRAKGLVDSEMSVRILKSTIGSLEAFNDVRNDRSLAHGNELLNHAECTFIFSHISAIVAFLKRLDHQPTPIA